MRIRKTAKEFAVMTYSRTALLVGFFLASGCSSYRAEPLSPNRELQQLQQRSPERLTRLTNQAGETGYSAQKAAQLSAHKAGQKNGDSMSLVPADAKNNYDPSDGLNEAEMVMIALSFNPDLRERRHAMARIGQADLFGMVRFKPEMRVNVDSATVGIAADSEMLYTLLMPSLRQAWRDDEAARRAQSQAEMLADEANIVRLVRRAQVTLLAEQKRLHLAEQRRVQRESLRKNDDQLGAISPSEYAWITVMAQQAATQVRAQQRQVDDARRELNRLLGFDPSLVLRLSDSDKPLVGERAAPLALSQLDEQLLAGRFELKIEEALYKRAEYTYSQALMGQYPRLRLAPAVTYDREDGTSFKLGASVRIPWPDDAAERAEDAATERARARAAYVAKLHELRAQAHQAHAHVQQANDNLIALESQREQTRAQRVSAEQQAREQLGNAGNARVSELLLLLERCEMLEWEWVTAALDYRLASIDLDHATGRLNRYGDETRDKQTELKPQ
jgi:outer membrane protein TolC